MTGNRTGCPFSRLEFQQRSISSLYMTAADSYRCGGSAEAVGSASTLRCRQVLKNAALRSHGSHRHSAPTSQPRLKLGAVDPVACRWNLTYRDGSVSEIRVFFELGCDTNWLRDLPGKSPPIQSVLPYVQRTPKKCAGRPILNGKRDSLRVHSAVK